MRNKRWDLRRAYKSPGRLKSEMYTFVTRNHESKKKSSNKNVVDDELKYEDYKNALFNRIRSKDHNIESYRTNKIYLSFYDDNKNIYLKMDITGYFLYIF